MRQTSYGTALTLGLLLILSTVIPVQSGMMGQRQMGPSEGEREASPGGMMGMMGQGGMGGGSRSLPEGMGMPRPSQLVRMLKAELGLSDEQAKQLTQIFSQATKAGIKQRADIRIAELELRELIEADPVDMGQVEGKL